MINLLALSLAFSIAARADVIFIDMNNVSEEIDAVRGELAKRTPLEKLILFPRDHQKFVDQSAEKNRVFQAMSAKDVSNADYFKLKAKYDELKNSLNYDAADFKKDLASVSSAPVSTVMISGHHVKGDVPAESEFYGEFGGANGNGGIFVPQFLQAFKDFPGRNNVSSVYLLGCRSAIPQDLGAVWKTAFPKANYIVGYENTGYVHTNPAGQTFIRNTLRSEKSILASKTTEEAMRKFRQIAPRSSTYGAAACITLSSNAESLYISSGKAAVDLSQQLGCKGSAEKVQKAIAYMKCVEDTGGNASCPLKDVTKMNALAKDGCDFKISDTLDAAVKFRGHQKVLENLMSAGAEVNFSSILAKAPESLRAPLAEPINLNDARSRLEKIKKSIDSEFSKNQIYEADIEAVNDLAAKKKFFDTAALAISSLDISQYESLRKMAKSPPTDAGGILRAQAYQQKMKTDSSLTYKARIDLLKSQKAALPSGSAKEALTQEIQTLESFATPVN